MTSSLELIYREHHTRRRGVFFLVHGEERGSFLKNHIAEGKEVLDIGCRDGALTKYYAEGNTVTGLDIDSEALDRAQSVLGIATVHTDLNGDWNLEKKFDVVVACEIIEHLYYPSQVLQKISAVLKPEGILLGSLPNAFSLQCRARYLFGSKKGTPLQDPTHINHFSVREFIGLLKLHGFTDIHIEIIVSRKFRLLAILAPYLFAHSFMFSAKKHAEAQ